MCGSAKLLAASKPEDAKLSVDQALYVAKQAGFFTKKEVQMQIMRSPPFSDQRHPFMLENFFQVPEPDYDESGDEGDKDEGVEDQGVEDAKHFANPIIHSTIQKYFRPSQPSKFWNNNEEWLSWAEGRGTRKRAAAHVIICRGSGIFKVNGESDMFTWWPHIYNRFDVCQPFKLTGTAGIFDVFAEVRGGGLGGQAGAARLAVARALLMANPACHDALQRGFCLLEDTRQVMSKTCGRAGARKSFPWSKR